MALARPAVKIVSTDPSRHPAIRFNYLSTDQDRREWPEAVRISRSILTQPAFELGIVDAQWDSNWTDTFQGAILFAAVLLNLFVRNRAQRAR